jgi:prepilin-type processing-associated H-X9-DG protein
VYRDIAPDRFSIGPARDHSRGTSNYLYVDGRVESISAAELKRKTDQGANIALPPGMNPAP